MGMMYASKTTSVEEDYAKQTRTRKVVVVVHCDREMARDYESDDGQTFVDTNWGEMVRLPLEQPEDVDNIEIEFDRTLEGFIVTVSVTEAL